MLYFLKEIFTWYIFIDFVAIQPFTGYIKWSNHLCYFLFFIILLHCFNCLLPTSKYCKYFSWKRQPFLTSELNSLSTRMIYKQPACTRIITRFINTLRVKLRKIQNVFFFQKIANLNLLKDSDERVEMRVI